MEAYQLRLFSVKPVMIFECPCGETETCQGDEAVYHGWLVPANMKALECDGRCILAICRHCHGSPRSVLRRWERWLFGPADGDVFHWLQRQEWPQAT